MTILNCKMDRKELFSENVELLNPYFQSQVIENPEAIDESEDFDGSMDAIQERIQSFS